MCKQPEDLIIFSIEFVGVLNNKLIKTYALKVQK